MTGKSWILWKKKRKSIKYAIKAVCFIVNLHKMKASKNLTFGLDADFLKSAFLSIDGIDICDIMLSEVIFEFQLKRMEISEYVR